ncbi:MAG: hypothetical protein HY606_11720 [Planctomycetes bacterium]|nr:hypothetical protein [Planctomycetota bacterium]
MSPHKILMYSGSAAFRGGMQVATGLYPDKTCRNRVHGCNYVEFDDSVSKLSGALG